MTAPRPRVVAVGGGHGTSVTLRAARRYAGQITAVVSVADDGGSSGRLREALGIPAPGDLRRCLVALADPSPLAAAFEHRFDTGELHGHAVGNLVIAALAAEMGDFTTALAEAGRVLGAHGSVLPATTDPVVLKAEAEEGTVHGQVAVEHAGRIVHVSTVPPDPTVPPAVVEAIEAADQIVLGPGSLFTSVVATIAVPGVRHAIARSGATVVYVANLAEGPDTRGFDVGDHVRALLAHGVEPDLVVHDPAALPVGDPPLPDHAFVAAPLADPSRRAHDPELLANVLANLVVRPRSGEDWRQ